MVFRKFSISLSSYFLFFVLMAYPAMAHIGGLSNIELEIKDTSVFTTVTVLKYDFGFLIKDILTGMPEVPVDEVLANQEKIFSYIPKRLHLSNGEVPLTFKPISTEIFEKTGDLIVKGVYESSDPITTLNIECTLFEEPDPRHQNMLTIRSSDKWDLVVLRNDGTTAHSLNMTRGTLWSRFMEMALFYFGAFSLGAIHALTPGHGKTLVGAYLVGSQGRIRDAIVLGGVVTITHTTGIFILGLIMLAASAVLLPAQVQMWASLFSGILILIMGFWLMYQRVYLPLQGKGFTGLHPHPHPHGHHHEHDHNHDHAHSHGHDHGHDHHHQHEHDHSHAHNHEQLSEHGHAHGHQDLKTTTHVHGHEHPHDDHGHSHAIEHEDALDEAAHREAHLKGLPHSHALPAAGAITLGTLLTLGISGGIVPCPEALVALLMATGSGKIFSGLVFVFIFSLGLAAVLITIGIIMVKAGQLVQSRFKGGNTQRLAFGASAFSAVLITIIGGYMCIKYGQMLLT